MIKACYMELYGVLITLTAKQSLHNSLYKHIVVLVLTYTIKDVLV